MAKDCLELQLDELIPDGIYRGSTLYRKWYSIMHYYMIYIELEVKSQSVQGNDTSESRFYTVGIIDNSMSIISMHTSMSSSDSW